MKANSFKNRIHNMLIRLSINETVNKSEFIKELYGSDDYYLRRSFDAMVCNAKKAIKEKHPSREFVSHINNQIKRIS